jgi:DNA-directed RNA polymerase
MYESSEPLEAFQQAYSLPKPPSKGDLDIRDVLLSPYFFS